MHEIYKQESANSQIENNLGERRNKRTWHLHASIAPKTLIKEYFNFLKSKYSLDFF